ncbi:MAG TPA: M56 family metallopeptidase, partial [Geothrix sp.]|nr:M56 family metallopeptidase [Geothrix sp.]
MTTLLSPVLPPLAQTLGWTLIHFLWQGAALGLAAWIALLLLRGASARARYGAACAGLLLMVAAPVATFFLLQVQAPSGTAGLTLGVDAAVAAAGPVSLVQRAKALLDPSLPWLLAGWAAGVLLLSFRFLGSWVRVQRLRRRSAVPVPAEWHLVLSRLCRELKLSRTVRLLQSAAVEVPTALGWLRPVILLPACALTGLAPLQLEAILAHELAHIRRGDFLVNLIQSLVEVLLFYHPAVWWLSARIRTERELCCDDVAATLCGDPLILARALTDLEALREPHVPAPNHLAMAANGGSLMHRVRHLLHPALPVTSGARVTALALLAASLLGAAGVALQEKGATKSDKTTRIIDHDEQRKLDVRMKGDVKLNAEAPEPVVVSGDGSFRVEEKKGGKTRAYAATKDKATYTVDGKEQPLDKEGKDWVRGIAKVAAKAQAGKALAERHSALAERHAAVAEAQARVFEIHAHRMEEHARELEAQALELETHAEGMTPEERARVKEDLNRAKADL